MILVVSVSFVLQNPTSLYVDLSHVYYISEKVSFWHDEGGLFDWRKIKQEYSQIIFNTQGYLVFFILGGKKKKGYHKAFFLSSLSLQSLPAQTQENSPILLAGYICKFRNSISGVLAVSYFGLDFGNFVLEIEA